MDDLVLLVIDPARVDAEIRYERPDGAAERFPHIYGPLRVDAVVAVVPFPHGRRARPTRAGCGRVRTHDRASLAATGTAAACEAPPGSRG